MIKPDIKKLKTNELNTTEVDQEFESDSIEYYRMLSNEFDYDKIRLSENFVVI